MDAHLPTVGLAVVLFASTNIDDLFLLVALLADPSHRTRAILLGQLAGIGVLFGASVAAAMLAWVVPGGWLAWLGLVPIAIGVQQILQRRDEATTPATPRAAATSFLTVAAVTLANGGDNLAVYIPVFANLAAAKIMIIGAVFIVMTVAWVAAARWLVTHPHLREPTRRYGERAVPFVLIALGVWILHDGGAWA